MTPWPGLTPRRTLLLPIPRRDWAPPAMARHVDGLPFLPKSELHVTIAGRAAVAAVARVHGPGRVEPVLRAAFDACDWRYRRTGRVLRLQAPQPTGPPAGAIVECLALPGLAAFYRALAAGGCALPTPPAHVTLWTHRRAQGIGIADDATLARLCVEVLDPGETAS